MKRPKFTITVASDDPNHRFFIPRAIEASGVQAELRLVSSGKKRSHIRRAKASSPTDSFAERIEASW
jgi:hypothetical protein